LGPAILASLLNPPEPNTYWPLSQIKEFESATGARAGALCKTIAAMARGKSRIYYSPISWNRATGVFAVLFRKEKGQLANVDPPGWNAANHYRAGSADRGHMLPRSVGGSGGYENIVTQQSGHNRHVFRIEADISQKIKNPSACAVCVMVLPVYGVAKPAPRALVYASVLATNSGDAYYSSQAFVLPKIYGHLLYEPPPWWVTQGYHVFGQMFGQPTVFELN
jgi:DNA/RNA non-specific endonuclease